MRVIEKFYKKIFTRILLIFIFQRENDTEIYWSLLFNIYSNRSAYSEEQLTYLVADLKTKSSEILLNGLSQSRINPETIVESKVEIIIK